MPQVLTTNALISCPHAGGGVSSPSDPTWSVSGGVVLVEGDTGKLPLCVNNPPCHGYTLRSMGLNATQIKGKKVILVTDFNQSETGLPLTMTEFHPVKDDTSPAPIPDGQDAPPLPPPLADNTKPAVTVPPTPPLVFTKSSNSPPTLEATFEITSAHPLKWILTLLHEPESSFENLNSSQPAGLALTTSDGSSAEGTWVVSPLTITLKMTAAYMQTLGTTPGLHRFFMTAVSQRGLSSFAELDLTVKP